MLKEQSNATYYLFMIACIYGKNTKPWVGRGNTELIILFTSKRRERKENITGKEIKRNFNFICEFIW